MDFIIFVQICSLFAQLMRTEAVIFSLWWMFSRFLVQIFFEKKVCHRWKLRILRTYFTIKQIQQCRQLVPRPIVHTADQTFQNLIILCELFIEKYFNANFWLSVSTVCGFLIVDCQLQISKYQSITNRYLRFGSNNHSYAMALSIICMSYTDNYDFYLLF